MGPAPRITTLSATRYFGQVDGVNGHAQRLQQRCARVVDGVWHRKTTVRGHEHVFGKAALVRVKPAEVEAMAEVGVSLLAHLAAAAGLCRVDSHPCAWQERGEVAVETLRPHRLHHAAKLVAQDQRRRHHRVADAPIGVGVQVAAADADGSDAQQGHARSWRARTRHPLHPQVGGTVEAGGQHGCGLR